MEEWKKRHCKECLSDVPTPESCYICHQERKSGFNCAKCLHFTYYSDNQICTGFYETGTCFCVKYQGMIKKALENKNCDCEFSLIGYSVGHSIHNNGLVKPFFRGSKLCIKLVCRSCEKIIQTFKLNCSCHLEQKKHQHLYSRERCLNCATGDYVRLLSKADLEQKYQTHCQNWQEKTEIQAQISIKKQYKYDGASYWAGCSFCEGEIRGKVKDKEPLSRNKVSFWTENESDRRIICNTCLRKKEVVKLMGELDAV